AGADRAHHLGRDRAAADSRRCGAHGGDPVRRTGRVRRLVRRERCRVRIHGGLGGRALARAARHLLSRRPRGRRRSCAPDPDGGAHGPSPGQRPHGARVQRGVLRGPEARGALARAALGPVLLSARRYRALEPALWPPRVPAVPVRGSHAGGVGRAAAVGAGFTAHGPEALRRRGLSRDALVSPPGVHAGAGRAQSGRGDVRPARALGSGRHGSGWGALSCERRPDVEGHLRTVVPAAWGVLTSPRSCVLVVVLAAGDAVRVLVLGATSAIAQAAARIWAERGEELLLVARDPSKLAAVADDLRTRGGTVATLEHDLNDDAAGLVAQVGAPDVVLLAQGMLGDPNRRDRDPDHAEVILRTNLVSPVRLLTLLAPALPAGACIAALSSVAGDRGRAKVGVYGASKAGLDSFLSALRQRLQAS